MYRAALPICLSFLALPALAGGYSEPAEMPPVVVTTPEMSSADWSGPYVGLQYGFVADGNLSNPGGAFTPEFDGTLYGFFGGYRHDFGQFVVGGEVDWMTGEGELSRPGLVLATEYDRLVRVGVEGGWDAGRALIYGTVGFADVEITTAGTFGSPGYFYGIGVDFAVTDNVVMGFEALQHEFTDFDGTAPAGTEAELMTLGINVALRF